MINFLIYYVAMGEKHRGYCRMSLDSLYMNGYEGQARVFTDQPWEPRYAPSSKVTFTSVSQTDVFGAKRLKASAVPSLSPADYDAILFLDCDVLALADPSPLLARAAENPSKFYVAHTHNRRIVATRHLGQMLTAEQKAELSEQMMLDSYAIAFAPTEQNLQLVAEWDAVNVTRVASQAYKSDAFGLNVAVIEAGRIGDAVFMPECERLNGIPKPTTIIAHYIHGTAELLMAKVFKGQIEQQYLSGG